LKKLDVLMLNSKGERIIFCKTKAAVNKLAKNCYQSYLVPYTEVVWDTDRIMEQFHEGHIIY
jgi:ATP-dependent RNA helicase DeaD